MKKLIFAAALLLSANASADALSDAESVFGISLLDLGLLTCQNQVNVKPGSVGRINCSEIKDDQTVWFKKSGFKTVRPRLTVETMFVQWLEAIDAVGTPRAEAEKAKYEKLTNRVRLL